MPRGDAFKKGQGEKKSLNTRPERSPVDAYGSVKKEMETDADLESGDGVAVAEKEIAPSPAPLQEPLPPWLQHFKKIPITQIRPGDYQKRLSSDLIRERVQKDAQLEAQMRESIDRGLFQLDVHVMQDPDSPEIYYPCQGMHRRIEIAQRIGVTEVTCYVHPYNRDGLALGTYFENSEFSRLGLNIIEEGLMFHQTYTDHPGWTQDEIAAFYKIPDPDRGGRDHVYRCLQAARAMPDVQKLVFDDPERATRVVGILSQMDSIEKCVEKRAPIIQGFLEKKLTVDQVGIAVDTVLQGGEFALDEAKAKKGVATPRTIGRFERAIAARKGFGRYFSIIGDEPPSLSERAELEKLRDQLNIVLSRQ